MREYPSSLTENVWEILAPLLPSAPLTLRGRPQLHTKREILNGILYILRTGGAWRMMPHDPPHWKTCYHYFRLWAKQGWWKRIHDGLRDRFRLKSGKKAPTAAVLDSRNVRTASQPGVRGYDAGKKITGRKRHILVDTQGNLLGLQVTTADVQDRDRAGIALRSLEEFLRLVENRLGRWRLQRKLEEEIGGIDRHR